MTKQPNQDPIEELLAFIDEEAKTFNLLTEADDIPLTKSDRIIVEAAPAIRALQARCKELEGLDSVKVTSDILEENRLLEAKLSRVIEAGNWLAKDLEMYVRELNATFKNIKLVNSSADEWRKAIAE